MQAWVARTIQAIIGAGRGIPCLVGAGVSGDVLGVVQVAEATVEALPALRAAWGVGLGCIA